ncbi:MAG TPA: hypothetical protein VKT82_08840 [Ktedonobacterales bacterium]|nr:hypothetical protein [Ktedonobacterales bacterium]
MDTLPSVRRLPWPPGTFLLTLAAMIAVIVIATDTLHTWLAVGGIIALGLLGGLFVYRNSLERARRVGKPSKPPRYAPLANPYDPTDYLPAVPGKTLPTRWPRLRSFARAAPFLGVGLAFCFHYKIASDLLSARPASDLFSVISVTALALGFAIGLAARPFALRPSRPGWMAWGALAIVITEWLTLFMLFTATFDGTYRSAIAPAVVALGAVVPLTSIARELMERRYSAQLAGMTISGPSARPSRFRALWRSGGARFAIGALGLVVLATYILLSAPSLNGPSLVVRVWPIILAVACILIPRGKADEASSTLA